MGHVLGHDRRALRDTGAIAPGLGIDAIDPRTRVVAAVMFAIAVVALHDLAALACALLAAVGMMAFARLPVGQTLKRMAMMDGFIIVMLAMLPFTVPGDPIFVVFGLTASWQGLWQAVEIALKANAVILALMALVGSMEPVTLGHALHRLKVPDNLVYLLMFTVRYVEVLQSEYLRLRVAMKARGFKAGNNRHTYRSIGYLVGMMLVRAIERSERILAAMRCRGFTGRIPLIDELAFTHRDLAFSLVFAVVVAGIVAVQVAQ
ncbi:cobalt ECF transporter T component CbiQ [Amorphus sp. 3PC139-8]|uniref:cobalt ECF transporter T component CbiQ n=1 Tax=Amorphus sp. 3PC139-8 TaxID=2735676 RepID=UPI00345DBDF8